MLRTCILSFTICFSTLLAADQAQPRAGNTRGYETDILLDTFAYGPADIDADIDTARHEHLAFGSIANHEHRQERGVVHGRVDRFAGSERLVVVEDPQDREDRADPFRSRTPDWHPRLDEFPRHGFQALLPLTILLLQSLYSVRHQILARRQLARRPVEPVHPLPTPPHGPLATDKVQTHASMHFLAARDGHQPDLRGIADVRATAGATIDTLDVDHTQGPLATDLPAQALSSGLCVVEIVDVYGMTLPDRSIRAVLDLVEQIHRQLRRRDLERIHGLAEA